MKRSENYGMYSIEAKSFLDRFLCEFAKLLISALNELGNLWCRQSHTVIATGTPIRFSPINYMVLYRFFLSFGWNWTEASELIETFFAATQPQLRTISLASYSAFSSRARSTDTTILIYWWSKSRAIITWILAFCMHNAPKCRLCKKWPPTYRLVRAHLSQTDLNQSSTWE